MDGSKRTRFHPKRRTQSSWTVEVDDSEMFIAAGDKYDETIDVAQRLAEDRKEDENTKSKAALFGE